MGNFLEELEFKEVAPVAPAAKLRLLDTVGCIVFSASLPYVRQMSREFVTSSGPYGVMGHAGGTSSVGDSAFLHGFMVYAYELAGTGAWGGSTGSIVPAAISATQYLAARDDSRISGRDFLRAFVGAAEIQMRLAEWVGFATERYVGWHTPAFHGAVGASAVTAALMGLDATTSAHAMAIAADMAGGGLIHSRNNSKRAHMGRTPASGILSAILARDGLEGGLDVLEDPRWGYRRTLLYGTESLTDVPGNPLDGLGSRFDALSKVSVKYYPFHSAAQSILDNMAELHRQRPELTVSDVASITVGLSTFMFEHGAMLKPAASLADTNFSFPYAAALGFVFEPRRLSEDGASARLFLDGYSNPDVASLQQRVRCESSDVLDAENPYTMDTTLRVDLVDGNTISTRTSFGEASRARGKGAIEFGAQGDEAILTKFDNLTVPALGETRARELREAILNLDALEDVTDVWRIAYVDVKSISTGDPR
jgi:2-methylcitrate dehydratase PrpD